MCAAVIEQSLLAIPRSFLTAKSLYMERARGRRGHLARFLLRINIHEPVTEDGVNRSKFRHRPIR